jgi:selenocysteine-specific elongation factor
LPSTIAPSRCRTECRGRKRASGSSPTPAQASSNTSSRRSRLAGRDRLALAAHRLELTPEEQRAREGIDRLFREAGLKPPETTEVAAAIGASPELADRMLKLLLRQKALVRLDTLVFHSASLGRLRQDIAALRAATGGAIAPRIDVATFKERYGLTRKYAIPLLEYLDRERITRRVGDARIVV